MRAGEIFTHAHWLNEDKTPLVCKVTRVAKGSIYYRPLYADGSLGKPMVCGEDEISRYVKAA